MQANFWHKAWMKLGWRLLIGCAALLLPFGAAFAQLVPAPSLPPLGGVVDNLGRTTTDLTGEARGIATDTAATVRNLADARVERLDNLVRRNPDRLEMTRVGPAVRGEIVAIDPDPATLTALEAAGFVRREGERTDALGLTAIPFAVPSGWSVDRALSRLRRIARGGAFAANVLYEPSGAAGLSTSGAKMQSGAGTGVPIGIVDGGVATHPALRGPIYQRGFVQGAPRSSAHGTAVASLIAGQGLVRGAAPGATLLVADIYGADPAGGNALALVRALAWLAGQRARVVAMSLVGPANPLVERAITAARARGMFIIAPVGNDGRAAPNAYPASYPGVIAVTGVDGRGRVLIEAGRATHLDYAAPGADMAAAGMRGLVAVRGTSFAVPLVAGRLAQHLDRADPLAALDAEARRGRGVGRGVVCGDCRTVPPAR
jgi:minor extracellular protease Epr